jgi:hypothetical protein
MKDIGPNEYYGAGEWHIYNIGIDPANIAVFHVPFPFHPNFELQVNKALADNKNIAIICSELHRPAVDFIKRYQHANVTYFTCGYIPSVTTHLWMDWFITTLDFYRNNLNLLDNLNPYLAKEFHFDILLGCTRVHREIVYNFVLEHQIDKQSIMSYYRHGQNPLKINSNFIQEDGVEYIEDIFWTGGMVKYQGNIVNISKIIPAKIYNQTAYSVVTETNAENDFTFYTEKIVKPILAQRLFIVIAGYNYLKNLRSLGFKTFDCVIDESYDDIEDNISRYNAACEQIQKLSLLPQQEVLDKIKPIVEHNKEVMLTTDWLGIFHKELKIALTPSKMPLY